MYTFARLHACTLARLHACTIWDMGYGAIDIDMQMRRCAGCGIQCNYKYFFFLLQLLSSKLTICDEDYYLGGSDTTVAVVRLIKLVCEQRKRLLKLKRRRHQIRMPVSINGRSGC